MEKLIVKVIEEKTKCESLLTNDPTNFDITKYLSLLLMEEDIADERSATNN